MNQFLLNQFLSGEVIVKIESNEQANCLYELASESIPGSCDEIEPWSEDDYIVYPLVIIESNSEMPYLNGRRFYDSNKGIIQYDMLQLDEDDGFDRMSSNINLEEVL